MGLTHECSNPEQFFKICVKEALRIWKTKKDRRETGLHENVTSIVTLQFAEGQMIVKIIKGKR